MKYIWFLVLSSVCTQTFAQDNYFQQEVNYKIAVALNDSLHTLSGDIEMEYINNSPDELDTIFLHLWPNAYSTSTSAFGKQSLEQGRTRFYFATEDERGNITGLDFSIDEQPVAFSFYKGHPDIAFITLNKPLKSGGRITIKTPFTVKIPLSFSRLGHVGQSYQVTQWYPKPAVYDKEGWHPMPYLDAGEFYSEFGSFDVQIALPENYVVGATGLLQTPSEKEFLATRIAQSPLAGNKIPASSPKTKTIRYIAERVHDFAWFADKRFRVKKGMVELTSGKKVDTWIMFTETDEDLWADALDYVNRSVKFLSENVGEYPWPQMTAVQSALSAGSGMEYPMITVIGEVSDGPSLDEVIMHEVGHNWFYGILAFNERDHPWMDEGINTYYEQRYMDQYYDLENSAFFPAFFTGDSPLDLTDLGYLYQARRNMVQAPETHSTKFSLINYWLGAYGIPAKSLAYLENYLNRNEFDGIMKGFYREWKFKHPQPEDFRKYFELHTEKNLDWFFDGLINSDHQLDYKLNKVSRKDRGYDVAVTNKGEINGPVLLSGSNNGEVVQTQVYEGFPGRETLFLSGGPYEEVTIDGNYITFDYNRQNNHWRTGGLLPKTEPFRFKFLGMLEDDRKTSLYWFPTAGWNKYDQLMLGMSLYNTTVPARRFEFAVAPIYAFGTDDLAGLGRIRYRYHPKNVREVILEANVKRFHSFRNDSLGYQLRYHRLVPKVTFELGKPENSYDHNIVLSAAILKEQSPNFSPEGQFRDKDSRERIIFQLTYSGSNNKAPNPFHFNIELERQAFHPLSSLDFQQYFKLSGEWNSSFAYRHKKYIDVRFFAGGFLTNTNRDGGTYLPGTLNLISQGPYDYAYADYYFGRSEQDGFLSQQVSIRDGGFKTPVNPAFNLGRSNNYILALNLKADLPVSFQSPIKPYFDIGYFDNNTPIAQTDDFADQLLWSGGLTLELLDGIVGLHFPLINSINIQDRLVENGNYLNRISFHLDLHRLDPWELLEGIREQF